MKTSDREELEQYRAKREKEKARQKAYNEKRKESYYKTTVSMPKEYKEHLDALGVASVNGLINQLVAEYIQQNTK